MQSLFQFLDFWLTLGAKKRIRSNVLNKFLLETVNIYQVISATMILLKN